MSLRQYNQQHAKLWFTVDCTINFPLFATLRSTFDVLFNKKKESSTSVHKRRSNHDTKKNSEIKNLLFLRWLKNKHLSILIVSKYMPH